MSGWKKQIPEIGKDVENLFKKVDSNDKFSSLLQDVYRSKDFKGTPFKEFVDGMDSVTKRTITAGDALSEYKTHLQSVGKTTTVAAKAMSGLKQVGAMALNIGSGFAAGIAFDFLLKGIDYVVNYSDNLIKKGEDARSSISEAFDEFSKGKSTIEQLGTSFASSGKEIRTTEDAISSIANKYTELSSGVDKFSNANKSLSTSEYEDYLNICNQVAEQFPTLVSGYDAQGNAILNMGNSASSAAKAMLDLYDAQMLSANIEIGDKLDDAYTGTVQELRGYIFDSEALGDEIKRIDDDIKNSQSLADANGYEFTVDDEIIATRNEKLKQQASYNLRIKDSLDQLTNSTKSYLQTSKSFTDINDDIENAFLGNMSLTQKDLKDVADNYDGDIRSFLYDNIIQPLSDLEPESQEKLSKLLKLDPSDMSLSEYKSTIANTLKDVFPDDKDLQNQMKRNLGFKDVTKDAENQLKRLTSKFGDAAKSLSLEELQKGYDLIVNDGFTGTFDQFKSKIEEAKQLAATEVDLKANTNFDAITVADETENAGDDYLKGYQYLQEAKEMFDKGLIGTDDFKTRAAYFSPTGADDPVNFAENYAKAARYLTEDSSGVINFLNDLSTKTNESGEALASFDAATGRWKYNIDDLQQASRDMGIGFEFMMDMFGRLEDYGYSNNFVGSIEDGVVHIADKAKELAEAKAELAKLESDGDYTTYDENGNVQKTFGDQTAIDQMRAKVQGLESDIQQTRDAMSQLVAQSADEYHEQVKSAKDAISTLAEERKQILEANGGKGKYGEDTQAVADALEEQIRQLASENHLELDANLNVVNKEQVQEEVNSTPIEVKVEAKAEDANSLIEGLSHGQSVSIPVEIDGEPSEIEAFKNFDGTITYTADIDGAETELEPVKEVDGTITYTVKSDYNEDGFRKDVEVAVDYIIGSQEEPETKEALLDYIKAYQEDPEFRQALMNYIMSGQQDPNAKQALLDYIKNSQEVPIDENSYVNYLKGSQENPESPQSGIVDWGLGSVSLPNLSLTGIINWISGGDGQLAGTAHKDGTVGGLYPIPKLSGRALAMGTLQDTSWLKPSWMTKRNQVALTGEEDQELVV